MLDGNVKTHYCILKKVNKADFDDYEEYIYQNTKQDLKEKDLRRYGIETVFIDDYSEITEILRIIESGVRMRNIFISGSADDFGVWSRAEAEEFCEKLAKKLVDKDYHIVSGFGKGIGTSIVKGALDEIYSKKYKHTDEFLTLRPFPYSIADSEERQKPMRSYREEMLESVGICIVIFGNKLDSDKKIIEASGCLEEIEIVHNNGGYIVPVGATGFIADTIWKKMKDDDETYSYIEKDDFDKLADGSDKDTLLNTIIAIIGKIQGGYRG